MKTTSLWVIRVALAVQFVGVLLVPSLVAAGESPRALWLALSEGRTSSSEVRRESNGRTVGVLAMRNDKLTFTEQVGQAGWEVDLASIKRVATVDGGRALLVVTMAGDEYVTAIMEPNLTPQSAKRASAIIERAWQQAIASSR